MLVELRIRNLAVIEDLEVAFEPGFNVITGETGAGKTILMRALGLLLGDRGGADLIRDGAREAEIEALFAGPAVAAALADEDVADDDSDREAITAGGVASAVGAAGGGAVTDPADLAGEPFAEAAEATVRRLLSAGRQRAYVNDRLVTVARLGELGRALVHVYGQHEHHTLLQADSARRILDDSGELGASVAALAARFRALVDLEARLATVRAGAAGMTARRELLEFQLEEMCRATLAADDVAALEREREVLRHAERLRGTASDAAEALQAGKDAIVDTVARFADRLAALATIDTELGEAGRLLEEARPLLEEAALRAGARARAVAADPARLEEIEGRMALLQRLARKHGCGPDELRGRQAAIERELAALSGDAADPAALEEAVATAAGAAWEAADALSAARAKAAAALGKRVTAGLHDLALATASVRVALEPLAPGPSAAPAHVRDDRLLTAAGAERVTFLFAPARGETPRPLARIASGGELSRVMLAIKAATAARGDVPTLLFDEVDAGVGGAVAEAVGRKLAVLAKGRQVICITHLPQIAACADHHFVVRKREGKGRRRAAAERLADAERVEELARMLAGAKVTEEARRHAAEMRRQGARR
jgi:DNA repair protein RecN (Recombination protein N)